MPNLQDSFWYHQSSTHVLAIWSWQASSKSFTITYKSVLDLTGVVHMDYCQLIMNTGIQCSQTHFFNVQFRASLLNFVPGLCEFKIYCHLCREVCEVYLVSSVPTKHYYKYVCECQWKIVHSRQSGPDISSYSVPPWTIGPIKHCVNLMRCFLWGSYATVR